MTQDAARHGLSAGVLRRSVQRDRRSDVVRLARQPQLRAVRQRDARSRQPPPEVRRLSLPPASSIRSTRPTPAATSRSTASGPATRSPISCSAIRAASQVGIGRADEHGRSTWLHVYGQDDWKVSSNLTLNYGLRYEINSQMTDVDNRLSAIDLPGQRASSSPATSSGNISPDAARRCCRRFRFRYVTSQDAGWTQGLLRPSYLRFAPRLGVVWALGDDPEDRRQRRLRRLPESVGLQRAAGARVDAAVLLREDGHRRGRRRPADAADLDRAARAGQRHGRRQHDGLGLPDRVREELLASRSSARSRRRRCSR